MVDVKKLTEKIVSDLNMHQGNYLEISVVSDNKRIFLITSYTNKIASLVLLEHRPGIVYIDRVDTTGVYPSITRPLIRAVINHLSPQFIAIFARPKSSYMFGGQQHPSKRILDPESLINYWKKLLLSLPNVGGVWEWSNYSENRDFPYEAIDDCVFFDDDPKRKVSECLNQGSVDDVFDALLCRREFMDGALIYWADETIVNKETGKLLSNWANNIHTYDDINDPTIDNMLHFFKTSDFSTLSEIENATDKFYIKFGIEKFGFRHENPTNSHIRKTGECTLLKGKRRK